MSGPHGTVCNLVYRRNRHNRLSAFGVIGTFAAGHTQKTHYARHNRLSAFGVIGTGEGRYLENPEMWSQSPFGFWGDWN